MIKQMLWAVPALLVLNGCVTRHEVNMTHEVKPIHITMDINLKVDRELDNFFDDIDTAAAQQ